MESSTLTIVVTVVVAFVILNYFLATERPSTGGSSLVNSGRARRHRVTLEMLDSVQQIAPGLTTAQIRYDLERTGDVNLTVDRYLNEGNLPFPPGYREQQISTENDGHEEIAAEKATTTVSGTGESVGSVEIPKGPFGGLSFEAKRKELVMEGRKKMVESTEMTWEEITKRYGFA